MGNKTLIVTAGMAIAIAGLSALFLVETGGAKAQIQALGGRPNGECVSYGSGSALHMCMHKFSDGTRCVGTGGGGLQAAGAGVALQCDFK
ncbi:MAG: hypothetical protein ACSLFL_03230 [Alphaproteobacteria bacterium]